MQIAIPIFLILSLFYLLTVGLVFWALGRLKDKNVRTEPFVSVIIAARNEAGRIRPTLEALEKLDYPVDRFEVLLVDDASTDATAQIIQSFLSRHKNWQLLQIETKSSDLPGKSNALQMAVDRASGEFIFTTDADCRVPAGWLRYMSACFSEDTAMVLGHSPLANRRGWFYTWLKFDNLFSAIVAAAPLKLGFAHTSMGRNLAYRRSALLAVGGYRRLSKFRSGDDVHLTELFRREKVGKIDYCIHPQTFVETIPPDTKREIFDQQIRKNSKTLKKSWPTVAFSLLVFCTYQLFFFVPFLWPTLTVLWLKVIVAKQTLELAALVRAAHRFHKRELILWLPLMQIVYPFYVLFFSILGSLQLYRWKK